MILVIFRHFDFSATILLFTVASNNFGKQIRKVEKSGKFLEEIQYVCVSYMLCVLYMYMFVCTCTGHALFMGIQYYYLMPSLHLFPSRLQLTVTNIAIKKFITSIASMLPGCPFFHYCLSVTNLWQCTISLGDSYKSQEKYTSNTTIDHHI